MEGMISFDVSIHARPDGVRKGELWSSGEGDLETLAPDANERATSFVVNFEEASDALAQLARMFIEPDGAYVWTGSIGGEAWQVEGSLFDRAGRLLYVTAKGRCPAEMLDLLLGALGWPAIPIMFQMTRQAVFLGETEFREVARSVLRG